MTDEIKHARDMTPGEREAKLAELRRGPPARPDVPLPEKHARDLSESERQEWLSAHKKRFK
jgi:ribosomal protein L29